MINIDIRGFNSKLITEATNMISNTGYAIVLKPCEIYLDAARDNHLGLTDTDTVTWEYTTIYDEPALLRLLNDFMLRICEGYLYNGRGEY